ncbi:unnamed protein product [Porites evermanni]|uniref:Uncharacterized protein n=1 Tax=Porites evermanni TaxID=104178 RepID=A0ABN8NBS7_9CNID|nr:unnamed protein product [Porites evermanni]
MAMERQQYFNNLQRKLLTRAMWGWTALLSEIETLDIPSQFDIFPEAYLARFKIPLKKFIQPLVVRTNIPSIMWQLHCTQMMHLQIFSQLPVLGMAIACLERSL